MKFAAFWEFCLESQVYLEVNQCQYEKFKKTYLKNRYGEVWWTLKIWPLRSILSKLSMGKWIPYP